MTIAFITDDFPTISTFINNQIEDLIELGHEVIIFPRCEHNPEKDYLLDKRLKGKVHYPVNYIYNRKAKWLFVLKLIIRYIFKNLVQILKSLNYFKFGREALNFKILKKSI